MDTAEETATLPPTFYWLAKSGGVLTTKFEPGKVQLVGRGGVTIGGIFRNLSMSKPTGRFNYVHRNNTNGESYATAQEAAGALCEYHCKLKAK